MAFNKAAIDTSDSSNAAQKLISLGQSVWYDNISRDLLESGELSRMMREWGVRGVTSNPTIFDNALKGSSLYDAAIKKIKLNTTDPGAVFETLAVEDIARAADVLRPVYDSSKGDDGFVSIEVSPLLAADTAESIVEGKRLFAKINRPNIMIKIPGTREGLPAVHALLSEGINVNITLLFSVENYIAVAETYCDALRERLARGQAVDSVRSVASFFVSRVDTVIDSALERIIAKSGQSQAKKANALLGQFGIANSKIAYKHYQAIFEGNGFSDLQAKGAAAQRPLWASTSMKNPKYRDVLYVEELIGSNTVNTMPHQTLEAFVNHGSPRDTLSKDIDAAERMPNELRELGIDVDKLLDDLQVDGVKKFSDSFTALNETIKQKLATL